MNENLMDQPAAEAASPDISRQRTSPTIEGPGTAASKPVAVIARAPAIAAPYGHPPPRRPTDGSGARHLPAPQPLTRRIGKHPLLMHYNRLIIGALAINGALFWFGLAVGDWWTGDDIQLKTISYAVQANFLITVVIRQQYAVNFLSWLATRAPTRWPLKVRWTLAKVYHFGGLHVGFSVSATLWFLVFVGSLTYSARQGEGGVSVATLVVCYALLALFLVIVMTALPRMRQRFHDTFESAHRFLGWAAVVLVWVNTVLFLSNTRGGASLAAAVVTAPNLWMLTAATTSTVVPWLRLRRVPIRVQRPSSHVAMVHLDVGAKPFIGSTRPISHNPLLGWHTFANIPAPANSAPGNTCFRLVVSRAGDWTSQFIDHPPSHVWVRGIPTAGMANVRKLFTRVIFVATGSGIGPMMAHLLANEVPSRLVWSARNPRKTYGDEFVDELLAVQPDAVIWDTDRYGKPDMVSLAYAEYVSFGAEAVICIANKKLTWKVVHGLERRGVPAFGPIWDS